MAATTQVRLLVWTLGNHHAAPFSSARVPRHAPQEFRAPARLAQSAERKALNLVVVGSSPTVGDVYSQRFVAASWLRVPRLVSQSQHLTLAGLEPAIFGSEDQRLIH